MTALALLPGCGADAGNSGDTSTGPTSTTTVAAPPQGPKTEKWVDLEVGDCLADLPDVDLGGVTVTVVDCAAAHAAEVYLRAPVRVNEAVSDVANRECEAGFPHYTGRPVAGSPFTVTYLIDSTQDRTSANAEPSTVICLLQSADGRALTGSARR